MFDCMKEATLGNTIKALAGLFVLNILHKQNQQYLLEHTNVFTSDFPGKIPIGTYLEESMIGIPKSEGSPLYIFDENE